MPVKRLTGRTLLALLLPCIVCFPLFAQDARVQRVDSLTPQGQESLFVTIISVSDIMLKVSLEWDATTLDTGRAGSVEGRTSLNSPNNPYPV